MREGGLLIDERPLIVQPSLVKLLGSIERAVVLQQIHWLLKQPKSGEIDEDGNKWVWGTLQEWCDDYFQMWKPRTLRMHLAWLRENGYLIVEQRSEDRWKKTNYYRIDYEKIAQQEGNDDAPSMRQDDAPSMRQDDAPSYKGTETSTETSADILNPSCAKNAQQLGNAKPAKLDKICKTVIDHLNAKTGRAFRNTDANKKFIIGRLKEGFTLDDLKAVIDAKALEWLDDETMCQYLRPATLFNATKFSQYHGALNAEKRKPAKRSAWEPPPGRPLL